MSVTQFNDLKFKHSDNKSLTVEMVVETKKYFPCHQSSDSLRLGTHCCEFNEDTKLHTQTKVYIQFQNIHKQIQIEGT